MEMPNFYFKPTNQTKPNPDKKKPILSKPKSKNPTFPKKENSQIKRPDISLKGVLIKVKPNLFPQLTDNLKDPDKISDLSYKKNDDKLKPRSQKAIFSH